jgi:hypothetical protein
MIEVARECRAHITIQSLAQKRKILYPLVIFIIAIRDNLSTLYHFRVLIAISTRKTPKSQKNVLPAKNNSMPCIYTTIIISGIILYISYYALKIE